MGIYFSIQPSALSIVFLSEARVEAAAAAGLVRSLRADEHAFAAGDEALRVVGRRATHHADRQRLRDVLSNGQELWHRFERLAKVVLIEASDDDALPLVGE